MTVQDSDEALAQTFVESSRDAALMVELDARGFLVCCQIEPVVNATWTAEVLGERIVRLYTLALMRVRLEQMRRINERGGEVTPGDGVYPSPAEVDEYRRRYLDF